MATPGGGRQALRVLTLGDAAAPPSVLFVHGFMGDAHDWAPLMAGVAAATGATVAAVDLPGHGESRTLAGEQGVPEVAAALAALTAQLRGADAAPPVIVGYSMGARVALQLALDHPVRFVLNARSACVCIAELTRMSCCSRRR